MRASDVMTPVVITVTPETTVHAAAKLLADNHIGGMPVVDANGRVVGFVSEGDLLHRVEIGTGKRRRAWWLEVLASTRELAGAYVKEHGHAVKDVMNDRVIAVTEDTPLDEIADTFERYRIKRVPVLKDGELVGIVSRANLIRALASMPEKSMPPETPDDSALRDSVLTELRDQRWALPRENVIVRDGVVHLWGVIDSEEERRAVLVAAEGVPGVKRVESHLEYPGIIPTM
ncbi:CBS domain-containing protein [Burkholderia ubonensis]|uniref:CBS domain-containing protein n=1 Tax=Burkholderia ubonensis TaxID=101571 RepID=UPI0008420D27|nr:CBS domain-containing protein [Burkholderia ubonensis]AOK62607.1 histidine kinase [Burkholderia ubonensis]MDY7788490.1 CBS domain-containing protein [Burkholderia ubonensis]